MVPVDYLDQSSFLQVGKLNLWPDWTSLRITDNVHAYVQCIITEDKSSLPSHLDPRTALRRPQTCLKGALDAAECDFSLFPCGLRVGILPPPKRLRFHVIAGTR